MQISGFIWFSEHAYSKGESLKCTDRWAGRISQGLSFTAASSTYYTHSNLNAAPVAMNGGSNLFLFSNNLRPLWASHLFISSILLNSRKVRRSAFPRKWILIYSGKKKNQQTSDRLFFEKLTNAFCPRRATLRFQEHLLRFVSFNFSGISFLVW